MKVNTKKIELLMANQCINTQMLAETSGISKAALYSILNHRRVPRLITLGKIAKALNVKVEDLIDM